MAITRSAISRAKKSPAVCFRAQKIFCDLMLDNTAYLDAFLEPKAVRPPTRRVAGLVSKGPGVDKILYQSDGDVGIITFNDPPLNVFGEQHWEEAIAAVTSASTAGHRALLIKADGPNFSRGAELKIFHDRGSSEAKAILERYFTITRTLEALPIPVIAAVQGLCQASGLELALACDFILAAQSARFSQPEALIGATTFLGGAQRLARRCGDARALEIVYTADIYSAAT
jgi:enoyl-CoA hydratase/carnithine racemase